MTDHWTIDYEDEYDLKLYKKFFDRMGWEYIIDDGVLEVEVPMEDNDFMAIFVEGMMG